jgi:hypothetical protein
MKLSFQSSDDCYADEYELLVAHAGEQLEFDDDEDRTSSDRYQEMASRFYA